MKHLIEMLSLIYILINICIFVPGIAESRRGPILGSCHTKLGKIEYIFPGYRLGCYMGKPFGESKK